MPDPISFEWDDGNSGKNLERHGVSDQEAEETFFNQPNFLFDDHEHSGSESRCGLFGQTNKDRRLTVIFTIRRGRLRIISARDMSRKERQFYEKAKKDPEV